MITDFHISGIGISLDLAIILAVTTFFIGQHQAKKQEQSERLKNDIEAVFEELLHADELINHFHHLLNTNSPELENIHNTIWALLKKIKLKAAVKCSPDLYRTIDDCIEHYKKSMENEGNPVHGLYSLALLLGKVMNKLQENQAVVDDYIKDRFDLDLKDIEEKLTKTNKERK